MIDPISGIAILGTGTMLYNATSYLYNWYYDPCTEIDGREEPESIMDEIIEEQINEDIEKEIKEVLEDIHRKYEISYDDVITELKHLFEYKEYEYVDSEDVESEDVDSETESESEDYKAIDDINEVLKFL